MTYNLLHPKRREIFRLFTRRESLRFSEIEEQTDLRSNELAYFLEQMQREGMIIKQEDQYRLSNTAEMYVPFFVEKPEELSPLPVILVRYEMDGRILLLRRKKKPYLDHWGLPGGRIRVRETIEAAARRIIKEKGGVSAEFSHINAVVHEHHMQEDVVHSYILIMITMVGGCKIKDIRERKWVDHQEFGLIKMIPSDRWLAQEFGESRMELPYEIVHDQCGLLSIQHPSPGLCTKALNR
ncbi:NUDIX domain-containing protein [Candidatus Woesearchaeota archaeon]|nr:NUDIX domain-containing protein [Candidatus Woesearchaeota archaeon]